MKSSGASAHCTAFRSNNPRERSARLPARLLGCLIATIVLGVAGCESGDSFKEHISQRLAPQPKVQTFAGDQHVVFEAALAALKSIDFRVTRSGAAQGVIEGISQIQGTDTLSGARQFTMEIHVRSYEANTTEVSVFLRIQEESAAFSGATDLPLKDHALYDSFFTALQQALQGKPVGVTPANSAK